MEDKAIRLIEQLAAELMLILVGSGVNKWLAKNVEDDTKKILFAAFTCLLVMGKQVLF